MDQDSPACVKLFQNITNLDIFEIKSNLDLYQVQIPEDSDTERLRNILRKTLLEEILKTNPVEKDFYTECLREAIDQLPMRTYQDAGYSCCLVGCKFISENHRKYIVHLKRSHPTLRSIVCNFKKKCSRRFPNVEALVAHLKQSHSSHVSEDVIIQRSAVAETNIAVKCNRLSCGGMHLQNLQALMSHYNSFHGNEERDCIFNECKSSFHAAGHKAATNHFRIKHKQTGKLQLKA